MRQARGVLPYAGLAVFIVAATVVTLVVATYGLPSSGPAVSSPTPIAASSAQPRASTDLSANGRLAYWRQDPSRTWPNQQYELWAANGDNSRRRVIAKSDVPGSVGQTRWSRDGDAVAYVEDGFRLVVARVDGVTTTYTLAPELRDGGWRITDHRSSPSGARIAVTVQRVVQRLASAQTDVFLAAPGGTFTRLTTTHDVVAADWISEDELLVNTTAGVLARLRVSGTDQLRPITALPAATPLLGADGRVYFLSGRVLTVSGADSTLVFAMNATVWSITVDGDDPRQERALVETDSQRLDGLWPGGGFVVHHGTDPAQSIVAPLPVTMPTVGGIVERTRVSPDGTHAIGMAGTNVVRFDVSPKGEIGSAVVLLGSVAQADAWFPRATTLAHVSGARQPLPEGRYVFALGNALWLMGADGIPKLLHASDTAAQRVERFSGIRPPVWSPLGDRVLTVESRGTGASVFQLVPITITPDGSAQRFIAATASVDPTVTWSPDGRQFAAVALPASAQDPLTLFNMLWVLVIDRVSGATVRSIPGRQAFWTKTGIVIVTNGEITPYSRERAGQSIVIWSDGEARTVISIEELRARLFANAPPFHAQVETLSAAPDGDFAAVRLTGTYTGTQADTFVVLRIRDGATTLTEPGDRIRDEAWSPTGASLGYTKAVGVAGPTTAIVRDADTQNVLLDEAGRFAGWSPDGSWVFVARDEGLYARRIAQQGPLVRVGTIGVPVSVANP